MPLPTLALLIDAENTSPKYLPEIAAIAQGVGNVIVRRLFGDFSRGRLDAWQRAGLEAGFSIDHEPSTGAGKNTADIRLTIAAMDLAAAHGVASFCIASADRDFAPLLRRLREGGHGVHAIGRATADASLRNAAITFHDLDRLVPSVPGTIAVASDAARQKASPIPRLVNVDETEREAVVRLLATLCHAQGPVTLSAVGTALRNQHPAIARKVGGSGLGKRLLALKAVAAVHPNGHVTLQRHNP